MTTKELIEKYGKVTKTFSDGTYVGKVNGYELGIEPYGDYYLVTINVNDGIRKMVETLEEIEQILKGLTK